MKTLQKSDLILEGNPERVLCRMFIPGEEELIRGTSRIPQVVERCLELTDEQVITSLARIMPLFGYRHRDITDRFHTHFHAVTHLLNSEVSYERQLLIGAYLSQEYAIEGAAYFNPSIVPFPEIAGPNSPQRFLMTVRAVGEGHISTIVFRTGSISAAGIDVDPPSPFVTTEATRSTVLRNRMVKHAAAEAGVETGDLDVVLGLLPDKFSVEDLTAALTQLDTGGLRNAPSDELVAVITQVAMSCYEVDFPEGTEIGERLLWPTVASERRGMEDARFTMIRDGHDTVRYRATYTGFDGTQIVCRALETDDFRAFSSMHLTGPGAQNKGLAFFPEKIKDRFAAVSRFDGESLYISWSEDGYHWNEVQPLEIKRQWWELVHEGNCGPPIRTEAGWLVLTHGTGPVREYAMGAMLLDLEDPSKVIGKLEEPLLRPDEKERNGYVPNVVYSCGSLVHNGTLVIPYGFSDWKIRFATLELQELLSQLA